jgi:hypothetical protein
VKPKVFFVTQKSQNASPSENWGQRKKNHFHMP